MNTHIPILPKRVLLRQAARRVAGINVLMVLVIACLAIWLQHAAMDRAANQTMHTLMQFHGDKLTLFDQEWQEMAIRLHNRLELLNLFSNPTPPWETLRSRLPTEANPLLAAILITDSTRQLLFSHTQQPIGISERFVHSGKQGWHVAPDSGTLYRWFALPFWLGANGSGELITFIPIDNSLLFRNTLPYTDLFLLHDERIVASSIGFTDPVSELLQDGTHWHDNQRHDQRTIPWDKNQPASPQLVIRHNATPLFTLTELLVAGIALLLMISWLFWQTLGVWTMRLTQRITTLCRVAQEFSLGCQLTPEIQQSLQEVRDRSHDEVSAVANAMAQAQESVTRELNARMRIQNDLQRISSYNQLLLEAAGEGIYGLDTSGRTTFINPAATRMIGWSTDQIIGYSLHDLIHHTRPDHTPYPRAECRVFTAIRRGTTQHVTDELFWRQDGSSFPVEYTSTPIMDQNNILGAVVVFRDISERIQAERHAREYLIYQGMINGLYDISYRPVPLKTQLHQALELILSVPWLAIQAKGAIFLAQSQRLRMVAQQGLDANLQARCQEVAFGHCLCGRAARSRTLLHADGIDARHDITFPEMTPHGHYVVPIHTGERLLGILTLYLQPGQPTSPEKENLLLAMGHTLGSMIERKELEESLQQHNLLLEERVQTRTAELHEHLATLKNTQNQLIQSERLAALGGLVAGISHEIKTPVGTGFTAVTYLESELNKFLTLCQQGQPRREELDHFLENLSEATRLIKANLKRASDLILSFKQVAVDQTSQEKRRFDLKEYLEETVFTLRPKLKTTRIRVTVSCPEGIWLYSFPGAISQVIANFILNSLTHAFTRDQEGEIHIQAGLLTSSMVFLHYRDNGCGMDADTLKQIYEPFFTTNRNQGGSGLGMHIVYNLVTQRLNGNITAQSRAGVGTEFHIQFPV
ncbi:MAG: PAS domain-containing protein [Magnetococcales bacterium]|nr:PAS domain-containing protein [Magnetococcales bacterium]NGZ05781.1 PAS domain-containing protein [Magnetococcales bacterium]